MGCWLAELQMEDYLGLFLDAGYDLPSLARMTPEDLTAIGIAKPPHRKRLTLEIHRLKSTRPLSPRPALMLILLKCERPLAEQRAAWRPHGLARRPQPPARLRPHVPEGGIPHPRSGSLRPPSAIERVP